jgi:CRISPR system Cascade subunit CasC
LFQQQLAGTIGTRTKRLGRDVFDALKAAGIAEKQATEWASQVAQVYGAVKKDNPLEIEQLVHVAPEERQSLNALIATLVQEKRAPNKEELDGLLHDQTAVDIAMFGRMLASKTQFNSEAAVQVAHAIGVHASPIEDDYFTAVDDLNKDDSGAGHVGESGFAQALFYQYICIDREQLKKNLGGDEAPDAAEALTQRAIHALAEAALKVGPTGKQNSYASRAYAHFALAEKGSQQPRSLTLAFLKPIAGEDYAVDAVAALLKVQANMDQVYGACADARASFNVFSGEGSAQALLDFVAAE